MVYVLVGLGVLCADVGAWLVVRSRSADRRAGGPVRWWRAIMTDEVFTTFHRAVNQHFAERGEKLEWSDDKGMAVGPSGAQMGMGNLAQVCAQTNEAEWSKVIGEHFSRLEAAVAHASADDRISWEQAKSRLTIRLMANEAVPDHFRGNNVWRRDLQGVVTMLAIDYPDTVATVSRTSAVEWGLPDEQLFDHAIGNLGTTFKLDAPVVKELANGPLFLFSAEHFFAASHALLLEKMPECVGPFGAVVAIPTRHLILCCPINTFDIVKDIGVMLNIAYKAETDGPGSITNQLYFYRDGTFDVIQSELGEDQKLRLTPPPGLVQVLNDLEAVSQES